MNQLSLFDAPADERPQGWPGGEDKSPLLTSPDMLASWPDADGDSSNRHWIKFGDELCILYLVDFGSEPNRLGIPALGLVLEGRFSEIWREALEPLTELAGDLLRRDPRHLKQTVTVAWRREVRPYVQGKRNQP